MKRSALVLVLALTACHGADKKETVYVRDQRAMDAWAVESYHQQMIEAGAVAQHTIYPHHFVANGAALNELGAHELGVLAQHYRSNAGPLNVRRNSEPDELYAARIDTVRRVLADAGVEVARIEIVDGPAGGSGITEERVLLIREADAAYLLSQPQLHRNAVDSRESQ